MGRRGGTSEVGPIDIWPKVFASDCASGLSLDGDAELFPCLPSIGDVSEHPEGGSAALRKAFAFLDGDGKVEVLHVHGRKLHQTVYESKRRDYTVSGIHRPVTEWCNRPMATDDAEVRRAVLRALVERDGLAVVARRMGRPDRQINDMISTPPRKSFGEKVARGMEQKWRENWDSAAPDRFLERLDWLTGETSSSRNITEEDRVEQYGPPVSDEEAELLRDLRELLRERWDYYAAEIRREADVARAYKAMAGKPLRAISDEEVARHLPPAPTAPPVERRQDGPGRRATDSRRPAPVVDLQQPSNGIGAVGVRGDSKLVESKNPRKRDKMSDEDEDEDER